LANLGDLELAEGHVEQGRELYEEALALFREIGQPEGILVNVQNLGIASLAAGRIDDAAVYLAESLFRASELGDARCVGDAVELLAAVAAHRGETRAAARLLGAAERLREESGNALHRVELAVHERTVATLRAFLDEAELAAAAAEGRLLGTEEALSEALAAVDSR
jgi:tetratricopeptide (TPR) repeat protein